MAEIQNSKRFYDLEEEKPNLFRSLDIGIFDLPARALQWQAGLFVIWCLEFEIYKFDIPRQSF